MGLFRKLSSKLSNAPEPSTEQKSPPQPKTALGTAAELGRVDEIKRLLANGADINAKDANGRTALMWAAFKGHADAVKELMARGADVNVKDNYDYTALKFVDLYRHPEIAALLKEA